MITTAEPLYWNPPRKIACRFFFSFFILYVLLNPNGVVPYMEMTYEFYIQPVRQMVVWMGAHVLHLPYEVATGPNGSGDTTYDYLVMLLILTLSLMVTIVWSVADRRARNYNKLFYWLTVIVRYYVAVTMVTYGVVKIIKLQFPGPTPERLLQTYGNSSPMGLAWTYMGYSAGFNYFTGFGELTCGLLLFFRRTSTLGALLGLVVAGNIMAVNYCFDVPVKLLSTMLTVMCLFLLSKDILRLIDFFILNKPAAPANLLPHTFKSRWKNIALTTLKYGLIAYTVIMNFYGAYSQSHHWGDKAPKPPLYGIFNVESFVRNNVVVAPLATDSTRWKKIAVTYPEWARVVMSTDSSRKWITMVDTIKHNLVMNTYADTVHKAYFDYELYKDLLILKGKYLDDSLHITLRRYNLNNFLLVRRGFHWINEHPFNR